MTDVKAWLDNLKCKGVKIEAHEKKLKVKAHHGVLTADDQIIFASFKDEIMEVLRLSNPEKSIPAIEKEEQERLVNVVKILMQIDNRRSKSA